jgi:hypothetical protein
MKKINLLLVWGLALLVGFSLAACSSDDDNDSGNNGGGNGGNDGPAPTEFSYAALTGIVENYGSPIEGVSVMSGDQTLATTDANGVFTLENVPTVDNRVVLKFKKAGYIDVVRSMAKSDKAIWRIEMISSGNARSESFDATAGVEMTYQAGYDPETNTYKEMKVQLPNGYVDANGNAYTGNVNAQMAYIAPGSDIFAEQMPGGDLAAVRADGSSAQLISFGMVAVQLTDDAGNALQLAPGKEATLTFPVPASMKDKATYDEIPLWSFDEAKGLWVEEGVAKRQGDVYVGTVKHFSWWNLDYPESRATLKVNVVDKNGKALQDIRVNVDDQRNWYTDAKGHVEGFVPSGVKMFVEANGVYENMKARVDVGPLNAGETKEVTLTVEGVSVISGSVATTGLTSKVCTVELTMMGQNNLKVITDLLGRYKLYVPASYKGLASISATNSKGQSTFKDVILDEKDLVVNFAFENSAATVATTAGKLTVKLEDAADAIFDLMVSKNDYARQVQIIDQQLSANFHWYGEYPQNSDYQTLNFSIEDYEAGKTTYEGLTFNFVQYTIDETNKNIYYRNTVYFRGVTAELTPSGDNMVLKVKDAPVLLTVESGDVNQWPRGTHTDVDGKATLELTLPIALEAKSYLNTTIDKVKSQLPSFMPYLEGKTCHVLIVSKSKDMGDGAVICYDDESITDDDYNSLCAKAEKELGQPVMPAGLDEQMLEDLKHHNHFGNTYFKDGKYVNIAQNQWYQPSQQEFRFDANVIQGESYNAKLTVRAFNNIKVPVSSLLRY